MSLLRILWSTYLVAYTVAPFEIIETTSQFLLILFNPDPINNIYSHLFKSVVLFIHFLILCILIVAITIIHWSSTIYCGTLYNHSEDMTTPIRPDNDILLLTNVMETTDSHQTATPIDEGSKGAVLTDTMDAVTELSIHDDIVLVVDTMNAVTETLQPKPLANSRKSVERFSNETPELSTPNQSLVSLSSSSRLHSNFQTAMDLHHPSTSSNKKFLSSARFKRSKAADLESPDNAEQHSVKPVKKSAFFMMKLRSRIKSSSKKLTNRIFA